MIVPTAESPRLRGTLAPAGALFRGLGDSARQAIVQRLARGEARPVDLVAELGPGQSTVSAPLACLRDCGLVDCGPQGRASMYSVTRPELMDPLPSPETLLAAAGNAVALCPVYGGDDRPSRRQPSRPHPHDS